jgi:phosphoglycolate phosphatase
MSYLLKRQRREMIKLVIFDFDGTIVDSKRVYFNSIARHLLPRGVKGNDINKAVALGLNLSETLKKFIPGFLSRWLTRGSIMRDVTGRINGIKKCHDVGFVKEIHHRKILVSNSLREFVNPVLRHLRIRKYFAEVHCTDEFADKSEFILKYLREHRIKAREAFYVGDRVSDVKLARKLGLHNIIISGRCAWDPRDEVLKAKPEFIVPDLRDVKRIVDNFRG